MFHAAASTTDGTLSDSDAQDLLTREPEVAAAATDCAADPESVKQLSLDQNLSVIQRVQQHLDSGDTDTSKFRNQLLELTQGYFIKSKKLSEAEIAKLRADKAEAIASTPGLLDRLCRLAYEAFLAERESRFLDESGAEKKEQLNLVSYVITLCQNYTDQSLAFAKALSRCEFALRLCAEMQRAWAGSHLAGHLAEAADKRLRQTLSIVYNMLFKKDSEIFFNLREFSFVETARPYLKSPLERFRFSAFLVLVFGCDKEEASRLLIQEVQLAEFLVGNLKSAHTHESRRSNGYHVIELAKCALEFSKNEKNKAILPQAGILPVLSTMLQQSSPEKTDEVSAALEILLSLSFDADCRSAVNEQCGPELKTLRGRPEWQGNRELEGITQQLPADGVSQPPAGPLVTTTHGTALTGSKTPDDADWGH